MFGMFQSLTLIPAEGKSRRGYRIKRILLTPRNENDPKAFMASASGKMVPLFG